jgi:hypothetical protein
MAVERADEDESYADIGRWLVPPASHGFGPDDVQRMVDLGRVWWQAQKEEVREIVCSSPAVSSARNAAGAPTTELLTTIADVIATVHNGWPAATVARLVMVAGVEALCEGCDLA